MDHSIFGSLMDINGDIKGESYCSQGGTYFEEQNNTCDPQSSVQEDYGPDYYTLGDYVDKIAPQAEENVESQRKKTVKSPPDKKSRRGRKNTFGTKIKELRFKCAQCDYRTWKKSNYQRHLLTHYKKLYRCTLCAYTAKHADDLANHIGCHKKKEPAQANNSIHLVVKNEQPTVVKQIQPKVVKQIQSNVVKQLQSNVVKQIQSNVVKQIQSNVVKQIQSNVVKQIQSKVVKQIQSNVMKQMLPKVFQQEIQITERWSYPGSNVTSEIKREVKEEPENYSPPVEVYLDEQSSSNSCQPESSVDSDFFPLAVHLDVSQSQEGTITQTQIRSAEVSVNSSRVSNFQNDFRYRCPYCSYRTWKTSNFQRHLCTHTEERPHKCHICKYSGKHHEDLKKHMLCHNKEITFAAIETVPQTDLLRQTITTIKRFVCLLCDFKTTRSSMLNRHQRVVHNDNRPYACDLCPYRSKQRDSLKKHMMAHTDERPFECDICHHRCRQKGDLKRHKLLHTGERPFACPHCPYRSNRTQLLKKHISRRHFIQESTEIALGKTNLLFEEFAGGHYLAGMF